MTDKATEIESFLLPFAEKENIEIVDVNYLRENRTWILRIFIDKEKGISIDDCEHMSHVFGACLDDSDIIETSYTLEISSPGLNRVLKKEESFRRFIGEKVKIQTYNAINNQRNFLGILLDFKNNKIKIKDVTKGEVEIDFSDIKKANLEADI